MSVSIQTGDIVEVRNEYQIIGASDRAFNILHYRVRSITDVTSGLPVAVVTNADPVMVLAVEDFYATINSAWKACGSAQVMASSTSVQKIYTPPRSEEYQHIPAVPIVGEIVGGCLPMQDSVTLLKKTGIGERWGMGRVFVAGIPEASQTNGLVDDDAVANYTAFGVRLASQLTTVTDDVNVQWEPVLWHQLGTEIRINALTRVVLSNKVIKAQKRRRPGKGI